MSNDWIRVHSEVDRAFENGTVFDASREQLSRWLENLCTGSVPNPDVQHREIIRGITINHIQMTRLIADLNQAHIKETYFDKKRIIEVRSRQKLELPVAEDIETFYRNRPSGSDPDNLITIVEESSIDKELVDTHLGSLLSVSKRGTKW